MDIVDFHAHILPGADHGSSSLSDSLCQLSIAKHCGVTRIVATPHFYPARDSVERFLSRRQSCYEELARSSSSDLPQIRLGAEVLFCEGLELLPELHKLCIHGSNILLLELPFGETDKSHRITVKALQRQGIDVVLAHADRYPRENIEPLLDVGAKIQLNTSSLCGVFRRKHLYKWLSDGYVVALGSDIHGTSEKAYKCFNKAKKKLSAHLPFIKVESDKMWNSFIV